MTAGGEDPSHLTHRLKWIGGSDGRSWSRARPCIPERKPLRIGDLESHVLDTLREVDGLMDHLG
jgi:hypothetical protein